MIRDPRMFIRVRPEGRYKRQEPTETSKQRIRTRYLGHVTGFPPIRDRYFLIGSCLLAWLWEYVIEKTFWKTTVSITKVASKSQSYKKGYVTCTGRERRTWERGGRRTLKAEGNFYPSIDRNKLTTNQNSLFSSRGWLSARDQYMSWFGRFIDSIDNVVQSQTTIYRAKPFPEYPGKSVSDSVLLLILSILSGIRLLIF
eukprot:sb/3470811/